METEFSKDNTTDIKSILILMMVYHHLFGFPDRIVQGAFPEPRIQFLGQTLLFSLAWFSKLCVSMYFFLSGFGIYRKLEKCSSNEKIIRAVANSIKKGYLNYWAVFIVFIPIAFLFFSKNPQYAVDTAVCNAYSVFSWRELIKNFIGYACNYNREWWFFFSYIVCLITSPFLFVIIRNKSVFADFGIYILIYFLEFYIFPSIKSVTNFPVNDSFLFRIFFTQSIYTACFFTGMLLSKNRRLERCQTLIRLNGVPSILVSFGILFLLFYCRSFIAADELDSLYCIPFTICMWSISEEMKIFNIQGGGLGKHSTSIWLIHTFFIYYFGPQFQKILYAPKFPPFILFWTIGICLICSILLNYFWKLISCIYFSILKKIRGHNND